MISNAGEKAVVKSRENDEIDLILMDIDLGSGIDGTVAAELILKDMDLLLKVIMVRRVFLNLIFSQIHIYIKLMFLKMDLLFGLVFTGDLEL